MKTLLAVVGFALALVTLPSLLGDDNKPPEGFTALFNGKDLTGWQAAIPINERLKMPAEKLAAAQKAANAKVLPHWKAENGVLVNDGEGDNLATIKDYGNFELLLDWKIEPKGDSGVYLRGLPQVQIWDSDTLDPKRFALEYQKGSGALWNNRNKSDKVPLKRADKAPGEWNHFHIVMKGDKVTVKLNGELVVDNVALDNLFEPGKPIPTKGPIELQRHPKQDGTLGKLWFRNIYIKELP
jgi:3-keto-disaccharide hydrolase